MKIVKNVNTFVVFFFLFYFLLGTLIFKDYGISWDEPYQRQIGYVSFEYIRGDNSLLSFIDRYYGVIIELPLVILERVLNIEDTQNIYYLRHYINFLLFYFGVIVFYFLNKKIFKSWKLALMACFLLIINPRIFANSFYNSKDIPLLVFYIFSIFTLFNYNSKKSKVNIFLHVIASSLVITSRIVGLIIPVVTIVSLLVFENKNKLKNAFYYLLGTSFFTYLLWPILWRNPLRIIDAVKTMTRFAYQENLPALYMGKFVSTFNLPWHYLPTWISITTPIVFLILFFLGFYVVSREFINKNTKKKRENFILIILLFVPILSAIIFKSTLYDGWRHFYFIYPLMVIFMIKGMRIVHKLFLPLLFIEIILVLIFMISNHPYQQVYFNSIFQNNYIKAKELFEFDYWGLSYRHALKYIVDNDGSEKIKLVVANNPGNSNSLILDKDNRNRIKYLSNDNLDLADYFISNYRWHPSDYNYENEFFHELVFGAKIVVVYKLKP